MGEVDGARARGSADTLEIVLSKGIRVNQLAKELGVESKAILAKCREEGLGEKVPNHMSVLSIGLTETVREWFSGGGVQTAVETAPAVAVATKPRTARKAAGSDRAAPADEDGGGTATMEQPPAREPTRPPVPVADAATAPEPSDDVPPAPPSRSPPSTRRPWSPRRCLRRHRPSRPPLRRPFRRRSSGRPRRWLHRSHPWCRPSGRRWCPPPRPRRPPRLHC